MEKDKYLDELGKLIYSGLCELRGGNFYVSKRDMSFNFLHIFADSLYEYNKGILLLERFFKADKCEDSFKKIKYFNEEDIKKISDFKDFTSNIPNVTDLTEQEIEEVNLKINNYKNEMEGIKANYEIASIKKYESSELVEFDSIDDDTLKIISENLVIFVAGVLSGVSFTNIENLKLGISSVDHEDYIDVIIYNIKEEQ